MAGAVGRSDEEGEGMSDVVAAGILLVVAILAVWDGVQSEDV